MLRFAKRSRLTFTPTQGTRVPETLDASEILLLDDEETLVGRFGDASQALSSSDLVSDTPLPRFDLPPPRPPPRHGPPPSSRPPTSFAPPASVGAGSSPLAAFIAPVALDSSSDPFEAPRRGRPNIMWAGALLVIGAVAGVGAVVFVRSGDAPTAGELAPQIGLVGPAPVAAGAPAPAPSVEPPSSGLRFDAPLGMIVKPSGHSPQLAPQAPTKPGPFVAAIAPPALPSPPKVVASPPAGPPKPAAEAPRAEPKAAPVRASATKVASDLAESRRSAVSVDALVNEQLKSALR